MGIIKDLFFEQFFFVKNSAQKVTSYNYRVKIMLYTTFQAYSSKIFVYENFYKKSSI